MNGSDRIMPSQAPLLIEVFMPTRALSIALSDALWEIDRVRKGWVLPTSAHPIAKLPIIRWFRFAFHQVRVIAHQELWGGVPSGYDEWVLWAILRGKC